MPDSNPIDPALGNYELYKLPSGVEVYARRLPNGQTAENYYCPPCLREGRTAAMEFRFGSGGRHVCPRCGTAYPVSAPPPPPLPPPPPPEYAAAPLPKESAVLPVYGEGTSHATASSVPPPPPPGKAPHRYAASPPPSPSPPPPTSEPPPPPPTGRHAWRVSRSPGVELEEIREYSPTEARLRRWFANFGRDGFLASVTFHIALLIVVATVVVTNTSFPAPSVDPTFQTSGGGDGGKDAETRQHQIRQRAVSSAMKNRPDKIRVTRPSAVTLPEEVQLNTLLPASLQGGSLKAGLGNGLGTGFGGGGRGLLNMPVLGMKIRARNLAVYLDNSGSMGPFLKLVTAEIKKSFPYADIYEHDAIRIEIRDGKVLGGRSQRNTIFTSTDASSDKEELSKKYRERFDSGSIGAWMDIMLYQGYDALIVFSDFQDGIEQLEAGKTVFVDRPGDPKIDTRTDAQKAWEKDWLDRCNRRAGGFGPRIYLFSIQHEPQKIWKECVKASQGDIKLVPNLRVETRATEY
jgi:hypothetical protein